MFILGVLIVALVLGLARGGRLANLALLEIRWRGLILIGFLLQVLIFSEAWQNWEEMRGLSPIVYLTSLVLLLVALAGNLHIAGFNLLTFGFGLNAAVIAVNGGYMPALNLALALAGLPMLAPGQTASNSIGIGPDTRLIFLADIFAIPSEFIFPNVFSVGDVLIAVGAFILIQQALSEPAQMLS